jgi:hypothetical protein
MTIQRYSSPSQLWIFSWIKYFFFLFFKTIRDFLSGIYPLSEPNEEEGCAVVLDYKTLLDLPPQKDLTINV